MVTPLLPHEVADAWSPLAATGAVLGILLAALGATSSTALLVYSPTKLQKRLPPAAADQLDRLRRTEADLIATARALTVLGATVAVACAMTIGGPLRGWVAVLAVAAGLLLFMGGLPPALTTTRAEAIVHRVCPLIAALHAVLRYPVVLPMRGFARAVLGLVRIPEQQPPAPDEIADDIMAAVADTDRSNALEEEEKSWIANIVDLGDLQVSSIMTPRADVVALPADLPLADALPKVVGAGHSRYPVHGGRLDDVVGVFYAKDALARLVGGGSIADLRVRDLMRRPLFVPETMGVPDLLRQLRAAKVHLAVVLDEYGGTSGIITVEDILEEIVGDIADEYDLDEEQPLRVLDAAGVLEVSGRTRIDEVNEHLGGAELPEHDEYDTIAGYVFSKLGRIPAVDEKFVADGVQFTVLRGDARHIGRLRLQVLQPAPSDSGVG